MYFRYDVALHQEEVCVKQVLNLSRMHMYLNVMWKNRHDVLC